MKYILISPYDRTLLGNRLFKTPSLFTSLKEKLNIAGYELMTIDEGPIKKADKIIFHDNPLINSHGYPEYLQALAKKKYLLLLLLEAPIVLPEIWEPSLHANFSKVITWNDRLIDNKKYFKISYSGGYSNSNQDYDIIPYHKRKLCVMVSGNKSSSHDLELYSERRKSITAFEKLCPDGFDLWGRGWDVNGGMRIRSYRGAVEDKIELMGKYKFCICFENMRSNDKFSGYITEKVHDCFFANCVPVYLGSHNITEYIPTNTFIDFNRFNDYEKLYASLSAMPEEVFLEYIENIRNFMDSEYYFQTFSPQAFIDNLYNHLVEDLPKENTIIKDRRHSAFLNRWNIFNK